MRFIICFVLFLAGIWELGVYKFLWNLFEIRRERERERERERDPPWGFPYWTYRSNRWDRKRNSPGVGEARGAYHHRCPKHPERRGSEGGDIEGDSICSFWCPGIRRQFVGVCSKIRWRLQVSRFSYQYPHVSELLLLLLLLLGDAVTNLFGSFDD